MRQDPVLDVDVLGIAAALSNFIHLLCSRDCMASPMVDYMQSVLTALTTYCTLTYSCSVTVIKRVWMTKTYKGKQGRLSHYSNKTGYHRRSQNLSSGTWMWFRSVRHEELINHPCGNILFTIYTYHSVIKILFFSTDPSSKMLRWRSDQWKRISAEQVAFLQYVTYRGFFYYQLYTAILPHCTISYADIKGVA